MRDFCFLAHVIEVCKTPIDEATRPSVDISLGCVVATGFKICARVLLEDVPRLLDGVLVPAGAGRVQLSVDSFGEGFFLFCSELQHNGAIIPPRMVVEFTRMLRNPVDP